MELILSIETTANICSISISNREQCLVEYSISIPNSHDQFLAELTFRALKDLQVSVNDLTAVAVSSGPGSFTGLRIGSAFAKGLCFDNSIKLVPVPTLSALAYNCKELASKFAKRIISVVHSHKNFFFYQFYDLNGHPTSSVSFADLEEIGTNVTDYDFVVGFGADKIEKGIQNQDFNYLTGQRVAKLGWKLLSEGMVVPAEDFVPSYYLEFQPKIKS
ncbi:MAG: tRNA (adenosine(37)-N6)-threonylcarbamoyltransferase complex dimerization subunit type 1 TsaB [Ignavibacteria bacterium]|nr:tRNA (adenosine(37)-N6)-threonylcarbamoyltransferase complex dimerization subunit type 1 TsaB [Ignavibacteria bacterium]